MALTVQTNVASLNAQRNLAKSQQGLNASLARLSSGLRINSAADDAAGLAISEKLRSQIRSLAQAERNAQDAISMVQTAESAQSEVSGILIRMRELAVQASTDTVGSGERQFIHDEFDQLRSEMERIAQVTEFNGTRLLVGQGGTTAAIVSNAQQTFQVGIQNTSDDRLTVTIVPIDQNVMGFLDGDSLASLTGAQTAIGQIDSFIAQISDNRAKLGAAVNRLNITVNNLATSRENLSAANSRIRDVDVAAETASLTRSQILMQAGVSVLAQANQQPGLALSLIG